MGKLYVFYATAIVLFFTFKIHAQVGINTTTPHPSAALEVASTNSGILIPRMTLVQRDAITSPATGLLIYQTDGSAGFYFYSGSAWTPFGSSGWALTGNGGTSPTVNFLGTTDANDLVVKTNNAENVRVLANGNVGIGTSSPTTKLHISSAAGGAILSDGFEDGTIVPFSTSGSGGSWTTSTAAGTFNSGTGGAQSGTGIANSQSDISVTATIPAQGGSVSFALRTSCESVTYDNLRFYIDGVEQTRWGGATGWTTVNYTLTAGSHTLTWSYFKDGSVNALDDRAYIDDVLISTNSSALRIVDGSQGAGKVLVSDANGVATWQTAGALTNAGWSTTGNAGTTAATNFLGTTDSEALAIRTNNVENIRVLATGNVGIGTTTPANKLQVVNNAVNLPVIHGVNTNTSSTTTSYGIRGDSNSTGLGSAGVYGISTNNGQNEIGVLGDYGLWGAAVFGLGWASSFADMPSTRDFGLFATCNYSTGTAVYAYDGNNTAASYALYGVGKYAVTGTKSASVPTSQGNQLLYCTESPEIWFEDLGGAKLNNGSVHVKLDPLYLETVHIDDDHKMRIFIQEEGESNGLIVIKDADNKGFTVKEKNGGQSNIEFSYRVMAKRRFYQNQRFGVDANQPFGNNLAKAKAVPPTTADPIEMQRYVREQTALKEASANVSGKNSK